MKSSLIKNPLFAVAVLVALLAVGGVVWQKPFSNATTPAPHTSSALRSIQLTWATDDFSLQDNFTIEVSTDGLNFSKRESVPGNQTAVTLPGLESGHTYYFRVQALNRMGGSPVATTSLVVP